MYPIIFAPIVSPGIFSMIVNILPYGVYSTDLGYKCRFMSSTWSYVQVAINYCEKMDCIDRLIKIKYKFSKGIIIYGSN
jgi:hypothetical protein